MRYLILVITLFMCGSNQTIFAQQSPTQVARAINSQRNFVQADVYLKILWEDLKIPPGVFANGICGYGCNASVFNQDLDNKPGYEAIVKLEAGEACRYLVFKNEQKKWRLVGFVDHEFNRYEMTTHRVLNLAGRKWLVVRGQVGSGTGFSLYAETIYLVSTSGVEPILTFWSSGHTYPWPNGLSRTFKTQLVNRRNGIDLVYTTWYSMLESSNKDTSWITNSQRLAYKWDGSSFILEPNNSTITEEDAAAIANAEPDDESVPQVGNTTFPDKKQFIGGGPQVFLKSNMKTLMRIAKGPNTKQKEWLRQVLREAEDTDEKKKLLEVLERA
jgi:hypothetical protein